MQKAVDIPPLARTVYELADDDRLRSTLDELGSMTAAGTNWKVRKRTLLDIMMTLEAASIAGRELADESDSDKDEGPESDEVDPDEYFLQTLPMYMAAILEKPAEPRIVCVEQAAFYLLSIHPEHQQAAQEWVDMDYKHARSFKKLLNADRYFRSVFERGLNLSDEFFEEPPMRS